MATRRSQRSYDHRLVLLVQETGDPGVATRLGVPRSTVAGWLRRGPRPVAAALGSEDAMAVLRLRVPHFAFRGQTPHEMYLGTGDDVPDRRAAARQAARLARLAENRARECAVCA